MMAETETKKKKSFFSIFHIRHLPLVFGRLIGAPHQLVYRLRRLNPDGTKYRGRLKGSAILSPNHTNYMDPLVVLGCFWYRRVFHLASKTAMGKKIRSFFMRGIGCIKIDRNISDIEAMQRAADVLEQGHLLSVFPQGRIERDGEISQFKSGAVLLSLKTGAPIIPMYSEKRRCFLSRRVVIIGRPIVCRDDCAKRFPSVSEIDRLTGLFHDRLAECQVAYRKITGRNGK